jgi:hypothetical protein
MNTAPATVPLACFGLFNAATPWWAIALLMFAF